MGKKNSHLKQSQFQAIVTLYNTIQYNTRPIPCWYFKIFEFKKILGIKNYFFKLVNYR